MLLRLGLFYFITSVMMAAGAPATLTYSTYLSDGFTPTGISADAAGNIYLAGNAVVDPLNTHVTALVVKLNPQGSGYLYTRYVGGSINESVAGIAVDSAGNAYIAGVTTSPDFPVTSGSGLATPPGSGTERSFVAKLDPSGNLVFSTLLGGSTNSFAQAVAVDASGRVVVSGISTGTGFPSTAGAYSVSNTSFVPYLLQLDATGSHLVFSATGIGGSSLAVDAAGNIYAAGTTNSLSYPTTAGTYQPKFPVFQTCFAPCQSSFQGPNQYVTKVAAGGGKLIFSTAVSGTGNTRNAGLAVDSAGNVYLTGEAGVGYPYTVPVPAPPLAPALDALATPAVPFVSKLDAAGQKLLYSVPAGGAGVQVDSAGNAYAGGVLGLGNGYDIAVSLPALSQIPAGCTLPQTTTTAESAYAVKLDDAGNVLGSAFIGGSGLQLSGVALSGSALWLGGATRRADFPFSPGAFPDFNWPAGELPGAYLGAVTFSAAPATEQNGPQVACVTDAADLLPAGPIVPNQLLTIFGTNLGPAQPVTASGFDTTQLGGVSVTFGSMPAPVLYASANQINVAVPAIGSGTPTLMTVSVNGNTVTAIQYPVVPSNPGLFVIPGSYQPAEQEYVALAYNADGTENSASNPAQPGTVVSVFVNALTSNPLSPPSPEQLYSGGGWSVTGVSAINPFVTEIQLQIPSSQGNFSCPAGQPGTCLAGFQVLNLNSLFFNNQPPAAVSFAGLVYVAQ